ncbi:MAG: hypothetical protein JKY34_09065 [Kordiimonadaceae bacterium]|nr:hypothetical protein [Kordiimonadaceae bacterium]
MKTAAHYLNEWRSTERAVCSDETGDRFFEAEERLLKAPVRSFSDAMAVLTVKAHQLGDAQLDAAVAQMGVFQ